MSTLRENIQWNVEYGAALVTRATNSRNAVSEELLGMEGFIQFGNAIAIRSKDLAGDMKKFLPLVGKWDKNFVEGSRELALSGVVKNTSPEITLRLLGPIPDTCQVEETEEIVTYPETREVRKRYKLVGDCLPLGAGNE